MRNTKKAPMWVRLKAEKKKVNQLCRLCGMLSREIQNQDARIQDQELELQMLRHYEEAYKWAMASLDKANDRTLTVLQMLSGKKGTVSQN